MLFSYNNNYYSNYSEISQLCEINKLLSDKLLSQADYSLQVTPAPKTPLSGGEQISNPDRAQGHFSTGRGPVWAGLLTVRGMSGNDYSDSGTSGGGPKAARLYKLYKAVKSSLFFRKTYGLVFFCYNK